jgi:cytochrome c biogenesis protein CcdA
MATLLLAGLAGMLASLSPCVLPLLPIILAAATAEHRAGPLALAAGLAMSFAVVGIFLGLAGFALDLDGEWLRRGAGVLMALAGLAMLVGGLASRFAATAEGFAAPIARYAQGMAARGLSGQFALGAVLGVAWAPCTGPVMGGAIALAAQADSAPVAAATMVAFALGSVAPLLLLGYGARGAVPALRRRLASTAGRLQPILGGVLAGFGVLVLTGADKAFEAWATANMPEAWVNLVVRI